MIPKISRENLYKIMNDDELQLFIAMQLQYVKEWSSKTAAAQRELAAARKALKRRKARRDSSGT